MTAIMTMLLIEIYWRDYVKDKNDLHFYATNVEVDNNFLICTDVDDNIHAYNMEDISSYHITRKAPQNCQ